MGRSRAPVERDDPSFFNDALLVSNESHEAVFTENVFVPVVGQDHNLYLNTTPDASQSPATWQWIAAAPSGALANTNGAVASTVVEPSLSHVQMILFVNDNYDAAYTYRWDGSKWKWHNPAPRRPSA